MPWRQKDGNSRGLAGRESFIELSFGRRGSLPVLEIRMLARRGISSVWRADVRVAVGAQSVGWSRNVTRIKAAKASSLLLPKSGGLWSRARAAPLSMSKEIFSNPDRVKIFQRRLNQLWPSAARSQETSKKPKRRGEIEIEFCKGRNPARCRGAGPLLLAGLCFQFPFTSV